VYRNGASAPLAAANTRMTVISTTTAAAPSTAESTSEQSHSVSDKEKEKEKEKELALLAMSESDRLEQMGHLPETFQLFAVVDEVTVSRCIHVCTYWSL
jgi:hypothetical protein